METETLIDKIVNEHTFPKACKNNVDNDKKLLHDWINSNSRMIEYKDVDKYKYTYNKFTNTEHYRFVNTFERLFEETINKYNWYHSDEDCLFWRDLLFSDYEKKKFMEYLRSHLVGIDIEILKNCVDEDIMCNFIMQIYRYIHGGLMKKKKKLFGLF